MPLRVGIHWQVDVVALPPYLTPSDASGEACVVLVVESGRSLVRMVELAVADTLPEPLLSAVTMAAREPAPPAEPGWPEVIEVRDEAVARWLGELEGAPFRTEVCGELPALRAAVDALFERMAPPEPVVFDDAIESGLLALAARLAELAPWRSYDGQTLLELSSESVELPFPVVGFLGRGGEVFGVAFYRSLEDREAMHRGFERDGVFASDGQALWFFDAAELSPRDRSAFAAAGYPRLDRYPDLRVFDAGEPRSPGHAERTQLRRALEAALAFAEAHPTPPEDGTRLEVELPRRRGGRIAVTLRRVAPWLAAVELQRVEHLEPLFREVAIYDMLLPIESLQALVEPLAVEQRPDADALAGLPEKVPVLVVRSIKREAVRAAKRVAQLEPAGVGAVLIAACSHCGTDEDSPVLALLDAAGEPLASLFDADGELLEGIGALAQELDGRLVMVFSAGGVRRLAPGRLRASDVVGMRVLEWRR